MIYSQESRYGERCPLTMDRLTEQWAIDLAKRTPQSMVPELSGMGPWWPWSDAAPVVRAAFRARVERFLDGDTSVLPT